MQGFDQKFKNGLEKINKSDKMNQLTKGTQLS